MKFLGIPILFWSIVCAAIAVIYYFIYPEPKTANRFTAFALRYFHSFTWVLLFLACLIAVFTQSTHVAEGVAYLKL